MTVLVTTPAKPLTPNAALETAVVLTLQDPDTLALEPRICRRMFDGTPPPSMGNWFVAVWSDNGRQSDSQRVRIGELFSIYLTITVRFTQPFDRWLEHRDFLEAKADAIRTLICQDQWNNAIINAANVLAGWRIASGGNVQAPVGFCESLGYEGMDPAEAKGPEWFGADPESEKCGIAQRIKFGKARRVQNVTTMT